MRRPSFAIALWMLWAFVLLASYYQRAWGLVFMGPSRWIDENSSLRSALELLSLLKNAGVPWRQPAFDEALARTLFAIWGASLVLAAALALGTVVCRLLRFRANDGRDALLYRVSAGFGAIAYGSLLLAAAGIYHAHLIRMLVAVPAAAGVSWFLYSRIRLPRERRAEVSAPLPGRRFSYDWLWRAVSLLALGFAFVSALAPEIEYDALWYHLWLPKVWMEHGRPVDIVSEFISLYPLTWELVFQAGVVFGGPVAGKLLHFAALLLCGLAVFQLARRVGVGVPPWLAVAFFFTVPTVLWEATTAYVDLALTLHVSLAIHALLHYIEGRRGDWFALAVLNLGLALATKHLGLFALLILFNGLLLQLWLRDRNFRRVLVPCVVLAAVSLLFPLPWYLRNWLASGNPVFPDLYSLFGASPIERWNDMTEAGWRNFEAQFGRPRTLVNELTLPWDVTVHAARYGGAFGPLFLLFLPGLALVRRWSPALIWVTAFVVVYVALWCSPLNGRELRFLIPLTPLLAVAGAAACSRLSLAVRAVFGRRGRRAFVAALALLLLLNLPPFTSVHEVDRVVWEGWLTHVIHRVPLSVVMGATSEEEYLTDSVPSYAAWRFINLRLPPDALVLTFSGGDHLYSARRRLWSDSVEGNWATWSARNEQEALDRLKELGVTHVLFDRVQLDGSGPGDLVIARPSVLARWTLEYEDPRYALYGVEM